MYKYIKYLKIIIDICASYDFIFQPQNIVIDLEITVHNTCDVIWLNAKLMDCRFYIIQSYMVEKYSKVWLNRR